MAKASTSGNSVVNMGLLEPRILNNTESLMLINMSHVLILAIAFNRQSLKQL